MKVSRTKFMPRFEYQGSELLVAWERVILLHLRLGIFMDSYSLCQHFVRDFCTLQTLSEPHFPF